MATHQRLLQPGMKLRTPYGDATIVSVDIALLQITTDLGTWDCDEVMKRRLLEHEDPVEWLVAPEFEVFTVQDVALLRCDCGCRDCSWVVLVDKRTKAETPSYHNPQISCRCEPRVCDCMKEPESAG